MVAWAPITDLPANWQDLKHEELLHLANIWQEQHDRLKNSPSYQRFLDEMRRRIAIETGVLERLYNIDRGTTQLLVERGIDAALIAHGATDEPPTVVVKLIRDHESAIQNIFDFVGGQRELSTSYIKQLHQLLTRNQDHTEALDQFGKLGHVPLLRGAYKRTPNNPLRQNGSIHEYCPPEQTDAQMDLLIEWHLAHQNLRVSPDVEAAWLHHRFTQIHPFQDGNGRVARMLASLIFIKAGWFPLVITRDERNDYLNALEQADQGELHPLVDLFVSAQKRAFIQSLSISEDVLQQNHSVQAVLDSAVTALKNKQVLRKQTEQAQAEAYAQTLLELTRQRFDNLESQIKSRLQEVTQNPIVYTRFANYGDEQDYYWRSQIIETARTLGYFANLYGYKSWVRLAIRVVDADTNVQTNLLVSFHTLGYEHRGVMACSAFGTRVTVDDENMDNNLLHESEALTEEPFEFTHLEEPAKLEIRFRKWIEEVIILGLDYWRRGM